MQTLITSGTKYLKFSFWDILGAFFGKSFSNFGACGSNLVETDPRKSFKPFEEGVFFKSGPHPIQIEGCFCPPALPSEDLEC